jgi:hypothetical protein
MLRMHHNCANRAVSLAPIPYPSRALTPQIAGPIVRGSHPRGSDLPSWRAAS